MIRKKLTLLIVSAVVIVSGGLAYSSQFDIISKWPFYAPSVTSTSSLPSPTEGDIIFVEGDDVFKGYNGTSWVQFGGSSSSSSLNISTAPGSANSNIAGTSDLVLVAPSTNIDLTLPAASTHSGKLVRIKRTDSDATSALSHVVMVKDAAASLTTLNTQYEIVSVVSDGTNWMVIDRQMPSQWVDAGSLSITATTTAPTLGSTSINKIWWRRVGSSAHIRIEFRQSSGGTAGSGDYLFAMPSGLSIDTTKLNVYTTAEGWDSSFVNNNIVGNCQGGNGTNQFLGNVSVYSSNYVRFVADDGATNTQGYIASNGYGVDDADQFYLADFVVPISGWKD